MAILRLSILLSLSLVNRSIAAVAAEVWNLVNATAAVCPGEPGDAITLTEPSKLHSPYVFTIFRTTSSPVTISYIARDANGKIVADQLGGVTLVGMTTGRRLLEEDAESEVEDHEAVEPRQLAARRRSGGSSSRSRSSYSSPRRRTSYSNPRRRTSYSSPRRRTVSYSNPRRRTSYSSPRRRTVSPPRRRTTYTSARRRGYTATGPRRRYTSYDNSRYNNPYSSYGGSYGFTSPGYASSLYGGRPPMQSSYGYYGANAYSGAGGGSGAMIALAAGGGLLAGIAGASLYHHWSGYSQTELLNKQCQHGEWTGLCSTCVSLYQAANCNLQFSPKINANRDDLMNTGFIPADFTWPIHVNITSITGVDYDASKICPPNSPSQQLFLTVTAVDQLSSNTSESSSDSFWSYAWQILLAVLGLCCCGCCCFAAFKQQKKAEWQYDSSSGSSDSEFEHGMHHAMHPPPMPAAFVTPGPMYPPQGHMYPGGPPGPANPYYDPRLVQPFESMGPPHSMSSMGSNSPGNDMGNEGGFMATAAPNGQSWMNYCSAHQVVVDASGFPQGIWGEAVAWAAAYEKQNPDWENDPRMRDGPVAHVIQAMMDHSPESMHDEVVAAGERLEEACKDAIRLGRPLPVIHQRV